MYTKWKRSAQTSSTSTSTFVHTGSARNWEYILTHQTRNLPKKKTPSQLKRDGTSNTRKEKQVKNRKIRSTYRHSIRLNVKWGDHLDGDAPFFFVWNCVFDVIFYSALVYDIVSSSSLACALCWSFFIHWTNQSECERENLTSNWIWTKISRNETTSNRMRDGKNNKTTEQPFIWWDVIICSEETSESI